MLRTDKQNCIPILQAILSDASVPPYWRVQALVALASAVTDWYEAEVRSSHTFQDVTLLTMTGIPTGGRNPVQIDLHGIPEGM